MRSVFPPLSTPALYLTLSSSLSCSTKQLFFLVSDSTVERRLRTRPSEQPLQISSRAYKATMTTTITQTMTDTQTPIVLPEPHPKSFHATLITIKEAPGASFRAPGPQALQPPHTHHHRRRSSAFLETGLVGQDPIFDAKLRRNSRPKQQVRFSSQVELVEPEAVCDWDEPSGYRMALRQNLPAFFPTLPRILLLALVVILLLPNLQNSPWLRFAFLPVGATGAAS